MKEYKPTLKLVKNKWYVSMTVPFKLRYILTNQIRLSTGTSDKNEALKRLPELAIELKKKISSVIEQNEINLLKEKVISLAKKLKKEDSINVNAFDKSSRIETLEMLSKVDGSINIHVGTFKVNQIKPNSRRNIDQIKRVHPDIRKKEVLKAKKLLLDLKGATNSFKQLSDEWLKINKWNREKSKKAYVSHIDKFLKVMGDLDINEITKVNLYDFAELMALKNNSSNQTIKNYMASIRAVLNFAERKGIISHSPAYNLKLETYGTTKKERKPFPFEMIKEMFKLELPN